MHCTAGMELRDTGSYGFLLPPQQIIPTGREPWKMVAAPGHCGPTLPANSPSTEMFLLSVTKSIQISCTQCLYSEIIRKDMKYMNYMKYVPESRMSSLMVYFSPDLPTAVHSRISDVDPCRIISATTAGPTIIPALVFFG